MAAGGASSGAEERDGGGAGGRRQAGGKTGWQEARRVDERAGWRRGEQRCRRMGQEGGAAALAAAAELRGPQGTVAPGTRGQRQLADVARRSNVCPAARTIWPGSRRIDMGLERREIDEIAVRVAEVLLDRLGPALRPAGVSAAYDRAHAPAARLVDAATLARMLGVERDWVYAHAGQLGAVRLGGPRGRLRFDLATLGDRLAAPAGAHVTRPAMRSRTRRSRGAVS